MILIVIGACGFIAMRMLLMFENRRRARIISDWSVEDFEAERESVMRKGDMKVSFRYGY
jgi:hypothetical protein